MERYEMAELLSKKAGVSLEEAREALENNSWDMLDAMIELERSHKKADSSVHMETDESQSSRIHHVRNVNSEKESSPFSNGFAVLGEYIKKLFHVLLNNDFIVLRRGKQILSVPVLVLIFLLFASFGFMLFLLLVGLFLDCRYQFRGRQLGQDGINAAMGKVSDLAGNIKESFQNAGGNSSNNGNNSNP